MPMTYDASKDRMASLAAARSDPARKAVAIVGSATNLALYATSLYIGTAGDVSVVPTYQEDDTPVTFVAHPVGYLQVQCRRVTACPANTVALFD